jgi:hypothetical protein
MTEREEKKARNVVVEKEVVDFTILLLWAWNIIDGAISRGLCDFARQ